MAAALRHCGFTVMAFENATRETMFSALRQFGNRLKDGGVGLFYFAGHGVQVKGELRGGLQEPCLRPGPGRRSTDPGQGVARRRIPAGLA